MEKCQSDRMPFVTGAAFEALQIAKRLCADKGSKLERGIGSASGSNFDRMDHSMRKNICSSGDQSPFTASPESQTVDSFLGYDYFNESPNSMNQGHRGAAYDRRSVNRKLWRRCENDVLDRSNSHINVDDVKIFTTPRKLIHSLQDLDDSGSGYSMQQVRRFRSPKTSAFTWTPTLMSEQNGLSQDMDHESNRDKKSSSGGDLFHGSSESVSSTEDVFTNKDVQLLPEVVHCIKPSQFQRVNVQENHSNSSRGIVCGIFVVLVAVILCLLLGGQDDYAILVPT
ncbi:UNVERIFIED_CONTAM: protein SINE1 [Sesamum angustifolium]|uniref:Protein SINE1 n=1 Tax=Sesamum angustifolium TaxID=2727405 RepID=A0AAW2PV78_9LAMI